MEEEKRGGGEDVVICLRDYKECWQNMTADCARVCVRERACVCVCVPWPNPVNSEHNNIRDSIFVTEVEQKIKNISVQRRSLQVNIKPSV